MSPYSIYSSHEAQIFPDNFYFILPTLPNNLTTVFPLFGKYDCPSHHFGEVNGSFGLKCPKLRLWLKTKPQVPPSKEEAQLSTLVS